MSKLLTSLTVAAALVLSACSTTSPDVVQRHDAQRLSQVQDATVLSSRPVVVDGSQSGIGGVAGGVTGAIAGSSVGGRREGQVVGVLGAVASGVGSTGVGCGVAFSSGVGSTAGTLAPENT